MPIDLTAKLGNVLTLKHPFWIASSHFTEKESILAQWVEFSPAALTLKTCTCTDREETEVKPLIRRETQGLLPRYGRSYYSDGPKTIELHYYDQTKDLLSEAKRLLPETKIGVSVLATTDENFDSLRAACASADYWELNLKYAMRLKKTDTDVNFFRITDERWERALEIIQRFLKAFAGLPVFIKLSRELAWLPNTEQCKHFLEQLSGHGTAGLIVANSLKIDVADFVHESQETQLQNGVLCGDALYDGTIKFIAGLFPACQKAGIPIIASGGMVDEQQSLMAMRAGADAVQLCTAFEYNKPVFYRTLVSAVTARIRWRGLETFTEFLERLRTEGIASIYSMPFMYYSTFWGDDVQKQIQLDVRQSERMDAVILSGKSLLDSWEPVLRQRIQRHRSIQFFLPNPDGEMFRAIQQAWGIVEPHHLEHRKTRVRNTRERLEGWFDAERPGLSAEENKRVTWGVSYYEQCPFYSFYLFDDKVYLAQYPFIRPDRLGSPVYVFFRSSPEYERLDGELRAIKARVHDT